MAREDPQLKLRLTEEMKARVTEAARANNRSVNAEIVARLESAEFGLRDQFAMAALTGLCGNDHALNTYVPEQMSEWAYQFADAMLAQREKR